MASMTGEHNPSSNTHSIADKLEETAVSRKAYVAPRLRRLGSVRELTLGTSNRAGEFPRTRNM